MSDAITSTDPLTPITPTPDGWLVPDAFRRLTPNRYSKIFAPDRCWPIELIVYHYTAGGLDASLRWLVSKDSSASAHFIVGKLGAIWQLAPITDRTWHAGGQTSSWRKKGQVNNRSIGIEIENWGMLTPKKDGTFLTYKGTAYSGAAVTVGENTWDAYTEPQCAALDRLTMALVKAFPQLVGPDGIAYGPPDGPFTGHQHVDPTRKRDPGPAFPWDRILATAAGVK